MDLITNWYFAPTEASKMNLLDEGKSSEHIWVTGNTGIEALEVLDFHNFLAASQLILTDSGGIQEEAPWELGVPFGLSR